MAEGASIHAEGLFLTQKQGEDLHVAHTAIKQGLETLLLLVDDVEDLIQLLAPDKRMVEAYHGRTDALNYVIATIERHLEDADAIADPEFGFRATRERRTAKLNGGARA